MLKKLLFSMLLSASFLFSNDVLTGDTKLSCEAILCLSSSTKPTECMPSLNRYFSIKAKKWKDTIKARSNFLKLCPTGGESEKDKHFTNLRDNIILNLKGSCDLDTLNVTETTQKELIINNQYKDITYIRITPNMNSSCKSLSSSPYTNIRPKYTCDPKKWYLYQDWQNGYEKIAQKTITHREYVRLSNNEKREYEAQRSDDEYGILYYTKYKKIPINKNCWVWENK